jgi:hypothetical protein
MLGVSAVSCGLLCAWAKLFGTQEIQLMGLGTFKIRTIALISLAIGVILILARSSTNPVEDLLPLSGWAVAWTYLSLRWKRNLAVQSVSNTSNRMAHLEICKTP